jgi:hypothetical protein
MKKLLPALAFVLALQPAATAQTQGEMQVQPQTEQQIAPQPKTENKLECEQYLLRMNEIVRDYDETMTAMLFGPQGINLDDRAMRAAAMRTLKLTKQIKKVRPPAEIAPQHKMLVDSLPTLRDYFRLGRSANLSYAMALANDIRQTLDVYHGGVTAMIQNNGLDFNLDPFIIVHQRVITGVEEVTNRAAEVVEQGLEALFGKPDTTPQGR